MPTPPGAFTLPFSALDKRSLPLVGGKGANLGEMTAAGFPVPQGFCVTTRAFERFLESTPEADALLDALDALDADDIPGVRQAGERTRSHLESVPVPEEIRAEIVAGWRALGEEHSYAVRSSATLEDLEEASFAGQQDTYLNVRGEEPLIDRVRACWASLFTDRAIIYRRKNGFPSRGVRLSVVVQRMVLPEIAGILFTADPISGHRRVCSIDASYGLGEALVSGRVNSDLYRVDRRTGEVLEARIGDKKLAIMPLEGGGTEEVALTGERRSGRVLGEDLLSELVELANKVEAHQGCPQDIEWCIEGGDIFLVQTRPITSLYPIPAPPPADGGLHVYFSFGHVQVMTGPMRPMGISFFRHAFPFGRPSPEAPSHLVCAAGGRIFVDLTPALRLPPTRRAILKGFTVLDESMAKMLAVVTSRSEFQADGGAPRLKVGDLLKAGLYMGPKVLRQLLRGDVEESRREFEAATEARAAEWRDALAAAAPGAPRLKVLRARMGGYFSALVPIFPVTLAAGSISSMLLARLMKDRGDPEDLERLGRGFEGNVTTEMALELGDLADEAREVPALAEHLTSAPPATAIDGARAIPGAEAFMASWDAFIARYGCRCPGEIDITTPRWEEDPSSLITSLVGMLKGSEPGAHRRKHHASQEEAEAAAGRLISAAGGGLMGWLRRPLVRGLVRRVRCYMAQREHGKYLATRILYQIHQALLELGALAASRGALAQAEDVWMLEVEELDAAVSGAPGSLQARVAERHAAYERFGGLRPPRLMTSFGETPLLPVDPNLPAGTLVGTGASAGIAEGVARVILDPTTEVLTSGEILVAPFTDPGWTPLFVHASALVMEAGGLMTHGSVVAREYGIPAVVGVDDATTRIRTGMRVRVDGSAGRVTLLDE